MLSLLFLLIFFLFLISFYYFLFFFSPIAFSHFITFLYYLSHSLLLLIYLPSLLYFIFPIVLTYLSLSISLTSHLPSAITFPFPFPVFINLSSITVSLPVLTHSFLLLIHLSLPYFLFYFPLCSVFFFFPFIICAIFLCWSPFLSLLTAFINLSQFHSLFLRIHVIQVYQIRSPSLHHPLCIVSALSVPYLSI